MGSDDLGGDGLGRGRWLPWGLRLRCYVLLEVSVDIVVVVVFELVGSLDAGYSEWGEEVFVAGDLGCLAGWRVPLVWQVTCSGSEGGDM